MCSDLLEKQKYFCRFSRAENLFQAVHVMGKNRVRMILKFDQSKRNLKRFQVKSVADPHLSAKRKGVATKYGDP